MKAQLRLGLTLGLLAVSACKSSSPVRPDPARSGGLSKNQIREAMKRAQVAIKDCYARILSVTPNLEGKSTMYFVIGPEGDVLAAKMKESDLKNAELESCMLETVQKLQFPKPQGDGKVTVTFPWVFKPVSPKK